MQESRFHRLNFYFLDFVGLIFNIVKTSWISDMSSFYNMNYEVGLNLK